MTVVRELDDYVTLTVDDARGVHERTKLAYHSGFYDGAEKSFRGFEVVERSLMVDAERDGPEPLRTGLEYDVGRTDPYHRGLLLRAASYGGVGMNVPLREARSEFDDCMVEGVPTSAMPTSAMPTSAKPKST